MSACKPTSAANASVRSRRGPRIRKGAPISTARTSQVEPFSNQGGSQWANQAMGVGIGCVSKMKSQRLQVAPRGIAARQFDGARSHHEPEEQPQHERDRHPRRDDEMTQAFVARERRQNDREKTGFQQQGVPLIRQKLAADDRERQVDQPETGKDRPRQDARHEQRCERAARDAQGLQRRVARVHPRERRQQPESAEPRQLARRGHVTVRRQNAVLSDEAENLNAERPEGDQIDDPEQSQKEPRRARIGGRHYRVAPQRRVMAGPEGSSIPALY